MKHFTMNRSGLIRCSARIIFSVSLLVSSIAIGQGFEEFELRDFDSYELSGGGYGDIAEINSECTEQSEHNDETAPENAEYIPIVYSGAAITFGAHSTITGNIQAVAAVTLGEAAKLNGCLLAGAAVTLDKDGKVIGDVTAGEAATLGATASINGDLTAGASVFIGAESQISGDLNSGSDITLGALATVGGNATAATSVTLGAHARVGKDKLEGNVRAVNGPVVLGQSASVKGKAIAGDIISFGMNARVGGEQEEFFIPEDSTNDAKGEVASKKDELTQKQKDLADRISAPYNELDTTIAVSREFDSGVYHAAALSTTADIILTFRGNGSEEPETWLFNVDTYISFGAKLTIQLDDNVAPGSTIVFNSGTYTTIGANSNIIGTIFAGTYITTGAHTTITGVGSDCGGMFTTNGAITMGAHSQFGATGCGQASQQDEVGEFVGYSNDVVGYE
jgi:predicted acyltransferase (DUF342 family)